MQMVKIRIPDADQSAKGMVEVGRRGRVICLPNDTYVVPEPALKLLKSLGIVFQEVGRGGFDYAEKTLRDAYAAKAQRRPARKRKVV